nr:tyrosine-type recombinase/integrase [Lachnospiraceae bacterium C1.1]
MSYTNYQCEEVLFWLKIEQKRNTMFQDVIRVPNPQTVNRTIKRIVETYNSEELLNAAKEKRDPELIPNFSCHVLRHTFATRLCEAESNLKVIQSVMGHRNIETTMDIYVEATEEKKQETFEGLASKLDNLF